MKGPRYPVLIALLAVGVISTPLLAETQQAGKVPRIGMLWLGSPEAVQPFITTYEQSLHQLGYVVGRTLLVEQRFADGKAERLPALAAELVSLNLDLIAVGPNPMIEAARRATTTIPIVMAYGSRRPGVHREPGAAWWEYHGIGLGPDIRDSREARGVLGGARSPGVAHRRHMGSLLPS
jgi:ABC-type uncharacterized transport system substrate-binding protein